MHENIRGDLGKGIVNDHCLAILLDPIPVDPIDIESRRIQVLYFIDWTLIREVRRKCNHCDNSVRFLIVVDSHISSQFQTGRGSEISIEDSQLRLEVRVFIQHSLTTHIDLHPII